MGIRDWGLGFSQRNLKWNSYGMKITQEVFNKLQTFIPIKNPKNKAFRLKENGENTDISMRFLNK